MRHAAVTFHHDIWRKGDTSGQSNPLYPGFSHPWLFAKCKLLPLKTECSQVYSTSAATYDHEPNTVYSKYQSA